MKYVLGDCQMTRVGVYSVCIFYVTVPGHAVCGGDRAVCRLVPETPQTLQFPHLPDQGPGQCFTLHADETELRPRQCKQIY